MNVQVFALPLNNNKKLNRWRFVIKTNEGEWVWGSTYKYVSSDDATKAANDYISKKLTKKNPITARKINVPAIPKQATCIGKIFAVEYDSRILNSAGSLKRYRHVFGKDSRPLLAATHDGRLLVIFGGKSRFTKRGIVG